MSSMQPRAFYISIEGEAQAGNEMCLYLALLWARRFWEPCWNWEGVAETTQHLDAYQIPPLDSFLSACTQLLVQ